MKHNLLISLFTAMILTVSVFFLFRQAKYTKDRLTIVEHLSEIYHIPESSLLEVGDYINKPCYPELYFFKMDQTGLTLEAFRDRMVQDSIEGYLDEPEYKNPIEPENVRARKITYLTKDSTLHTALIYFKEGRFYFSNIGLIKGVEEQIKYNNKWK